MKKEKIKKSAVIPGDYCAEDEPTKLSHPFVRVAFNFFAVILLGEHFLSITNAYFTSVIMFSLPLLLEHFAFNPKEKPRKILRKAQLLFLLLVCAVGIAGLIGIIYISSESGTPKILVEKDYAFLGGYSLSAYWLYGCVWVIFLFNCIDSFASKTKAEQKINKYAFTTAIRND